MASTSAADEYCFPNKATPEGSSAYYLVRFSPAALQDRQAAIFAWHRELQRLVTMQEQQIALTKLDWWKAEIEQRFEQSRHPLCHALHRLVGMPGMEYLLCMLSGTQMAIEQKPSATSASLIGGGLTQLLTLPYTVNKEHLAIAAQIGQYDYCVRMQLADSDPVRPAVTSTLPGPAAAQLAISQRMHRQRERVQQSGKQHLVDLSPIEILWLVWRNRHAMRQ